MLVFPKDASFRELLKQRHVGQCDWPPNSAMSDELAKIVLERYGYARSPLLALAAVVVFCCGNMQFQ